jgi:glutathione S-transferase
MLKIYGSDLSTPVSKVRFTAHALDLDYEYIQVNLRKGEHRTEDFMKLHPAGKIPVVDDDGFIVFESETIIRYLAIKHNSSLFPQDIKQRTEVDQWMSFANIHVGGAMFKILFNRVFAPIRNIPVDENALIDGVKFLDRFLPVVEKRLAIFPYLAGDNFSLADISLLSALDPVEVGQIGLSSYEALTNWRNVLKQKEFYTKCYKEYGESLKQTAQK